MVKKRPKSRPVRLSGTPNTPRDRSASDSVEDNKYSSTSTITSVPPVFLDVCRLCETKDGPFLDIFGIDKVTAKRMDEVLPFTISEKDELPSKICFRCSAKLEELYEFILKCMKTQDNLRTAMGKKVPIATKSGFRVKWEKQLDKKNISNDEICNALIKKAMEGVKDVPLNPVPLEEEKPQPKPISIDKKLKNSIESLTPKKDKEIPILSSKSNITYQSEDSDEPDEVNLKKVKLTLEKCDNKTVQTRATRSNKAESTVPEKVEPQKKVKSYPFRKPQSKVDPSMAPPAEIKPTSSKTNKQTTENNANAVINNDKEKTTIEKPIETPVKTPEVPRPPPINIMDHVSTIKVNSVGTLYLCKLCNRNFLKKEVVLAHGCAKNNVPKDKFLHNAPPRDIPKPPVTVKYIKMDTNSKKVITENKTVVPDHKTAIPELKPVEKLEEKKPVLPNINIPLQPDVKPKPKAGPASRKRQLTQPAEAPKEPLPITKPQEERVIPGIQFPAMPSLNSRYKLVPGPNNTFTLIEDASALNQNATPAAPIVNNYLAKPKSKKRKAEEQGNIQQIGAIVPDNVFNSDVIELDDNDPPQPAVIEQPYPVGLFTTPHHSGFVPNIPQPPTFTTPAMKKQSYTIVQTGNPSKLLISTKPQPVIEEPQKKKSKKPKPDDPQSKDAGYFTFINVDTQDQPSYVLPTDNIIQESQITTSTPASRGIVDNKEKDKYSCNMCQETFSREKKLLAHIQSHFNQMDEEDQMRKDKVGPKKKTRKS